MCFFINTLNDKTNMKSNNISNSEVEITINDISNYLTDVI